MSATGRSPVRVSRDFYETPEWCTEAILRVLPRPAECSIVTDPCAGNGAILRVVNRVWPHVVTTGVEIDPARATANGFMCGDALEALDWSCDLCITNPPYSLSFEFAQKAVEDCRMVAMLLRINWLASIKRADWLRKNTPAVFVLPKRPSFTGKGTDAADYAWMVWGLGHKSVHILPRREHGVHA